jgi:2-polyprenyl-3-methyl-5-hydroxy-6-metoxy-1,4-benzoquinol methylase
VTNRWETEYKAGRWAYLQGLQETARNGVVAAYLRHAMPAGTLLDVGCGEGVLTRHLDRALVTRYVGVDIAQAALDNAGLGKGGLDPTWARLACSPLEDFAPTAGERFAAIVFNEVLFFTDDPGTMLARYRDWLVPEGIVVVSMYRTPRETSGARRSLDQVWAALDGPGWTSLDESRLTNVTKDLTWHVRLVRAA